MLRQLVLIALVSVSLVHGDDPCTDWSDIIDDMLFNTLREEVVEAKKEELTIPEYNFGVESWRHVYGHVKEATIGDFTSFKLGTPDSGSKAATMCQVGNNNTLNLFVSMDSLVLRTKSFHVAVPIIPDIGGNAMTVTNSGNNVHISVSLISNGAKQCSANLNFFQLLDMGKTQITFENGLVNSIYQLFMNFVINSHLIQYLFNIRGQVTTMLMSQIEEKLAANGQKICEIIS